MRSGSRRPGAGDAQGSGRLPHVRDHGGRLRAALPAGPGPGRAAATPARGGQGGAAGPARGAGGGRGRAAPRGGGTRGARRFYGAIAGQGAGGRGGETGPRRTAYGIHMIQTPMPPMPPGLDPNFVFNQVMPLIAVVVIVLVGATAVRWILRGTPVGEAIAERIRMRA